MRRTHWMLWATLVSSQALAESSGWYLGATTGLAYVGNSYDISTTEFGLNLIEGGDVTVGRLVTTEVDDDYTLSGGLTIGVKMTPSFAIEASYIALKPVEMTEQTVKLYRSGLTAQAIQTYDLSTQLASLTAVGILPLNPKWNLKGLLGLVHSRQSLTTYREFTDIDIINGMPRNFLAYQVREDRETTHTGLGYGIGLEYACSEKWTSGLELYGVDLAEGGVLNLGLSFKYLFGRGE